VSYRKTVFVFYALLADAGIYLDRLTDYIDGVIYGVKLLVAEIKDVLNGEKFRYLFGGDDAAVLLRSGRAVGGKNNFVINFKKDKIGVKVGYHCLNGVFLSLNGDIDIQLIGNIGNCDRNFIFGDQLLCLAVDLRRNIIYNFQLSVRCCGKKAYRCGVGDAGIFGARNTCRHGIFDYIDRGANFYRRYVIAEFFKLSSGICGGKRNCTGFGAAGGKFHFAV